MPDKFASRAGGETRPLVKRRLTQFLHNKDDLEAKKAAKTARILEKQRLAKIRLEQERLGCSDTDSKRKRFASIDEMYTADGPIHQM